MSAATGTPIVPVVVVGTRQLLARGTWIFQPGIQLQIHVLSPVDSPGSDLKSMKQLAHRVRMEMSHVYRQGLEKMGGNS